MHKLIFSIAFRYLKSAKSNYLPSLITTISFCGIMISVATLIIVTAVQNGFRTELVKQIIGINAHVNIFGRGDGITNFEKIIDNIKNNLGNEVEEVVAVIDGKGMLINPKNNHSAGVFVKGVDQKSMELKGQKFKTFDAYIEHFHDNAIILGSELAFGLGVFPGSKVTLISPEMNETLFGVVPRSKTYHVAGIANFGLSQYNDILAFVPLDYAQKFFKYQSNTVSSIEVVLKSPEQADEIVDKVKTYLSKSTRASTWKAQNEGLLNALKMEKSVMILILSMFVVGALFSIFAGLTMMINDKYKSIAILMSMGFRRKEVGIIFFCTGMTIIIIGTVVGSIIGVLLAVNLNKIKLFLESMFNVQLFDGAIYFVTTLPCDLQLMDTIYIIIFVLFFGVLASVFPAIKATKYKPADTLKYF